MEVSIVNTTVERGSFFDVRVERFLPNPTVKRLNGTLFNEVVCGYSPKSGLLVDLTEWIGFQLNTMFARKGVQSPFEGKVKIPENTIMRIENAKFTDEGQVFFCELSMINYNDDKLITIKATKTLKTVYGEFVHFILFSFGLIN